ncbi:MAG: ABC transporter permease [Bacteroidetes bacterium]|nr:ABC transporter permease [Bacteroidota bacterium]
MTLLIGSITIGLILSLLALGVFISFRIYNFPDITAEGSITLGAAIAASLIVAGLNPVLATLLAFCGGFIAGSITGILHTRFNINNLLAGILVMTALYSVNLHVMGKSNVPLLSEKSLITYFESVQSVFAPGRETVNLLGWTVPEKDLFVLIFIFMIIIAITVLLYWFFRTDMGTAMRATGNNQQMIRALGVNTKNMVILGIAISNGLIGLSGALLAQYQGFADVQMGIGMVVWGLASVIIGEALITEKNLGFVIAGAVMGSVLFRLLVAIALRWGMNPNDLKLITALFVFIALILPTLMQKINRKNKIAIADYRK